MALDSVHPLYAKYDEECLDCENAYEGEHVVKREGIRYLPATQAHILDGMSSLSELGYQNYEAYKTRAVFPDYLRESVEMSIGMMHQKDAVIELPAELEYMREKATSRGETLLQALRRINELQLVSGRLGLLLDIPAKQRPGKAEMYISIYTRKAGLNWNETEDIQQLDFVTLDETSQEINDEFEWSEVERYRVLQLIETNDKKIYTTGLFKKADGFNAADMKTPMQQGVPLDEIPFTFINTKDISTEPDRPPLAGLARVCYCIYRGEADYRFNLFMQGQDTFVTIGDEISGPDGLPTNNTLGTRLGAGAKVSMEMGGDAKYVGVTSEGLFEQRSALENDRKLAATKTVQLGVSSGDAESGKSRKLRIAAETANLTQVALAGAAGLAKILRIAARWIGADPLAVKVWPNLEFAAVEIDGQNLFHLQNAKNVGAPISQETMHGLIKEAGITTLTYDQEIAKIENEVTTALPGTGLLEEPGAVGGNNGE